MKQVIFLVHRLHRYREDFYRLLKPELEKEDISMLLIYSKSKDTLEKDEIDTSKKDEVDVEWGKYIPIKRIRFFNSEVYWQPVLKYLKTADLIIVQQANKLLLNYFLIFFRRLFKIKMAYWGHGLNLQLPQNSFENKFKRLLIARTDWWFAYTPSVKKTVVSSGFDENKITVVNNAIDTHKLSNSYHQLNGQQLEKINQELQINSPNVGIFCGGIYSEKRIDFLIQASDIIKKEISDFHLIVIGSGPDEVKLKELIKTRDYIHFLGPKFDLERVPYFKLSKVFLMPGLVGLGVLDSFALETPMATTNFPYHSPEIEYLQDQVNGIMTENNVQDYANSVIRLLKDQKTLDKLVEGCKATAPLYNNETMVRNFVEGIKKCLNN
jgi:L-malate glycosyltransferase